MVSGEIINNRPLVAVTVAWKASVQRLVVLIDTGFTGELKLSEDVAKDLGLEITHTESVQLGNGKNEFMPASLALVDLEGTSKLVEVLISPGDTVAGVGLFKKFKYRMTMDFHLKTLQLEKTKTSKS